MSTVLVELKTFLDAIGTLGTLTMGKMPATPDAIGTLYMYGGQAPERRFGVTGVGYEKPAIQIAFRGAPEDYASPEAKAYIARNALMAVQPGVIFSGSSQYLTIDPQQEPFPIEPVDANSRHKIGFNFYLTREP
jgi:hypothetical protein